LRRLVWKLAVWFLIVSAVVVSLGRLLAPHVDLLRPQIERLMSERLGAPVRIERIEASWPRLSPRLSLEGVRIGRVDQQLLGVNRARLEFRLYNALRPAANIYDLVVLGLDVAVVQDAEGRWSWRLDRGARLDEGWLDLLSAGDILLRDAGVSVAPHGLPEGRWLLTEARLGRSGDELGVRLEARPRDGDAGTLIGSARIGLVDGEMASLEGYARVPSLAPEALLPAPADSPRAGYLTAGQVWLNWRIDSGARVHARLVLRPVGERAGPGPGLLTLDGHWQPGSLRARLDSQRLPQDGSGPLRALVLARSASGFAFEAEYADLGYLHALLAPWMAGRAGWPAEVGGVLHDVGWRHLGGRGPVTATGRVDGLSLSLAEPEISFSGLNASLSLAGDEVRVGLSGAPSLTLPALYPDARAFSSIGGVVGVRPDGLRFEGVRLAQAVFEARVDGRIAEAGDGLFLDLVVDAPRLAPDSPRRWLPVRGLPPMTRSWLADALLGVERASAVTTLFGRPGRWRDRIAPGSLTSVIEFEGLRLAYANDWPVAEGVDGEVRFVGDSMNGAARRGRVAGVPLSAPRVRIADTRRAEIELTVESEVVDAASLAELADALPLTGADQALAAMAFSGDASAAARIWFPVRHREDWRLLGEIDFDGSALVFPELDLQLDRIDGVLPFSRTRLGPGDFRADAGGQAVEFALDSRFQPRFRLAVDGRGPVPALLPGSWRDAATFLESDLAGSAEFRLAFEPLGEASEAPLGVLLTSDLTGVASSLPAPLTKNAASAAALRLELPLGDVMEPARLRYGEIVDAVWLRSGDYWQLGLGLGGTAADLPGADNFIIEGRLATLAADAWAGRVTDLLDSADDDRLPPGVIGGNLSGWLDLHVEDVLVGSGSLGALEAALNRENEYWRLNLLGDRVQGTLRIPADDGAERSLIVDLERLHLPAGPAQRETVDAPSALDPRSVLPFDIAIGSLRRGELELGEFRLSSHRDEAGIAIEQVTSRSDGVELTGSGAWQAGRDGPYSSMRLRLSTPNLGRTLTESGFDIALQRGNAVVEMDGRWPGAPLDLTLARFDGQIDLVVSDGAIPAASPGAGRVLGLVSLNSIPRRLRLDFSDVFGEGLAFDRIAGRFELESGVARTDDLRIDAPAAEIRMSGRTDLRERTYDQTLTVRPGVGSALPIIGALAGGPVGAAAGAALQQILDEPLKGIGEIRYAVDGTWESPRIRPVAVEPADVADG
jgi:uncharacterized protein (TIGR02099 family)